MQICVGSSVTHPLFQGPGTVVNIHVNENGKKLYEVFWQSYCHNGFHSGTNLELITKEDK